MSTEGLTVNLSSHGAELRHGLGLCSFNHILQAFLITFSVFVSDNSNLKRLQTATFSEKHGISSDFTWFNILTQKLLNFFLATLQTNLISSQDK